MLARTSVTILLAALLPGAIPGALDAVSTYSNPTNITNPYAPFEAGSVNIFRGRVGGVRTTTLATNLAQTRVITWDGVPVECCIAEEKDFEDGVLVEVADSYLAQDDAGNVRYFGEIAWTYENGVVVGAEDDSWLVGGPSLPGDPPNTQTATAPTMCMPANPQLGDVFVHADFSGHDETFTVVAVDADVKVPAGKFSKAIKLLVVDDGEDGSFPGPTEHRWVVPKVGVVKERSKGLRTDLVATSMVKFVPGP